LKSNIDFHTAIKDQQNILLTTTSYSVRNQDEERIYVSKKLSKFLSTQHNPPIVRKSIINNVSKYYNNITQTNYQLTNLDRENEDKWLQIHPSIVNQRMIGWDFFHPQKNIQCILPADQTIQQHNINWEVAFVINSGLKD